MTAHLKYLILIVSLSLCTAGHAASLCNLLLSLTRPTQSESHSEKSKEALQGANAIRNPDAFYDLMIAAKETANIDGLPVKDFNLPETALNQVREAILQMNGVLKGVVENNGSQIRNYLYNKQRAEVSESILASALNLQSRLDKLAQNENIGYLEWHMLSAQYVSIMQVNDPNRQTVADFAWPASQISEVMRYIEDKMNLGVFFWPSLDPISKTEITNMFGAGVFPLGIMRQPSYEHGAWYSSLSFYLHDFNHAKVYIGGVLKAQNKQMELNTTQENPLLKTYFLNSRGFRQAIQDSLLNVRSKRLRLRLQNALLYIVHEAAVAFDYQELTKRIPEIYNSTNFVEIREENSPSKRDLHELYNRISKAGT